MKNSVRDLRGQLEWTQADLAAKLGVSRQTINAIETEKYDPSLPLAFKIARIFRKPVEEIFFFSFVTYAPLPSRSFASALVSVATLAPLAALKFSPCTLE